MTCACSYNSDSNISKVFFVGDSVKLIGNPDSTILSTFLHQDEDYTFPFNNMVSMSVILEPPAIYHCFIWEQVEQEQQIYYMKVDDAIRYNWIEYYDSLSYDLSLDFIKTEMAGCSFKNPLTGKQEYIKPDIAMKWSSQFEHIPATRQSSKYYDSICSKCDDAKELSEYYNSSLFFQNKSIVKDIDKEYLLQELIRITQVQYVEYFFDFERDFDDFCHILISESGESYHCINQKSDFSNFKKVIDEGLNKIQCYNDDYLNEHNTNDIRRHYSKYLLNMNAQNLNYILNHIDDIEQKFYKSSLMVYNELFPEDIRIFFFNITYDENNKITIEKNYYNKEYITTTRIRGYY